MNEEIKEYSYIGVRLIEFICIAAIIFGALWEGTEIFNLTLPQFLMLYGSLGAVVSEGLARILKKKVKKPAEDSTAR